jgi:hypothetical protein
MVLLLQTARAASGKSCFVSGKIPLFLKVMQAARMQIILNTRQARIALLSHSGRNPAKFGTTSSGVPGHILVGLPHSKREKGAGCKKWICFSRN